MANLLTAKQAVDAYFDGNVSYWKLLSLVRQKQIPYLRIGGRIFFMTKTLQDWLLQNEHVPGNGKR